jgi:hypothetical protein
VVNAGSVGMPFGAEWVLLGPDVQLPHTECDLPRAAERARAAEYPQAEEFVTKYVLQPLNRSGNAGAVHAFRD